MNDLYDVEIAFNQDGSIGISDVSQEGLNALRRSVGHDEVAFVRVETPTESITVRTDRVLYVRARKRA